MFFKFTQTPIKIPDSLMIDIKILNQNGIEITKKAMIDTGSDLTSIPNNLPESLNLIRVGNTGMRGIEGRDLYVPVYLADIYIGDTLFKNVKVSAIPRNYILIGRDLINLWNLEINGKTKTFTIKPWSTDINDSYIDLK